MRCSNCYREIPDDALCCPYCGEENLAAGIRLRSEVSPEPQADAESQVSQGPQTDSEPQMSQRTQAGPEPRMSREIHADPRAQMSQETPAGQGSQIGQDTQENQQEAREVHGVPYTYGNRGTGSEGDYEQNAYQVPEKTVNWVPYLVLSIISTICCCPPFGIVAIVYAVKTNSEASAGDEQKAADSARKAKIWIIVAVASGIVWDLLMISLGLFSAMGGYYFY